MAIINGASNFRLFGKFIYKFGESFRGKVTIFASEEVSLTVDDYIILRVKE